MQQAQKTLKMSTRDFFALVTTFFGICIILALAGVIVGVIEFTSHISISTWIQVCWIVINILLTLVVCALWITVWVVGSDNTKTFSDDDMGVFFGGLVLTGVGCIICVFFNFLSVQSMTLLVVFCLAAGVTLVPLGAAMVDEQDRELKAALPQVVSVQIVQSGPCCSVCKTPGEYEVCLECERKHRREIQRVRSQNWRAKKAGEPATLTIAEWLEILESFHFQCAYCQVGPYQLMEHYIPIGQGKVAGGTTAKNCVPACYKCNAGKSNKHPEQ